MCIQGIYLGVTVELSRQQTALRFGIHPIPKTLYKFPKKGIYSFDYWRN